MKKLTKKSLMMLFGGLLAMTPLSAQDQVSRVSQSVDKQEYSQLAGGSSILLLSLLGAIVAGLTLAASSGGSGEDSPASPQ